ncbi:MAG: hypothetical protein AABX05_01600, partial [Nanoarchaeota archaeon]
MEETKKTVKLFSLVVIFLVLSVISLNEAGFTGAVVTDLKTGSELEQALRVNEEVPVIVILKDDQQTVSEDTEERKEAIQEKQENV